MKWICVLLLCVLSAPFATAQNKAAVKQAESACGPPNVKFTVETSADHQPSGPPQSGNAQIYIIEVFENPGGKIGRGPTIRIGMDGRWLGADQHDSYLLVPVEAGEHHLCVDWQSKLNTLSHQLISLANFTAQPEETYYFRARITSRQYVGPWYTLNLEPVNSDEAKLLLAQRLQGTSTIVKEK